MKLEEIGSILNKLDNFHALCYDVPLSADKLKPIVNEKMIFHYPEITVEEVNEGSVIPNQSAEGQFLTKIQVPISFFHRCPTPLQQLILDHFNKDKDYLLRCVEDGEQDYCRAVLSPMYTIKYDNHLIFPIILNVLKNENVSLRSFANDTIMARMECVIDNSEVKYQNHVVTPGIMITNSETGHSSLWIEPVVIINGKFTLASRHYIRQEYPAFRHIHKGEGIDQAEIETTVKKALEVAQVGVIQYLEKLNEPIRAEKALDFANSIEALPKRFTALYEDQWKQEENLLKERVLQDILAAASELPLLSKIAVEQSVGRWFGIFEKYENRMANLIESMEQFQGVNCEI